MAKEKPSSGWKNLRIRMEGLPAMIFTVLSVRDGIEDYKRAMKLSPIRRPEEFIVEEAK